MVVVSAVPEGDSLKLAPARAPERARSPGGPTASARPPPQAHRRCWQSRFVNNRAIGRSRPGRFDLGRSLSILGVPEWMQWAFAIVGLDSPPAGAGHETAHRAGRSSGRPAPSYRWTSAADLVFDPTLACCSADRPAVAARRLAASHPGTSVRARFAPSPSRTDDRSVTGQDLLLSRTMLSNNGLPYVGRFACDWHRLATTDPQESNAQSTASGARSGRRQGDASAALSPVRAGTGPGSIPSWAASHSETKSPTMIKSNNW